MALKMKMRSKKQKEKMRKTKRFKGGLMSFMGVTKKPSMNTPVAPGADEKPSMNMQVAPGAAEQLSTEKKKVDPNTKQEVLKRLVEAAEMVEKYF